MTALNEYFLEVINMANECITDDLKTNELLHILIMTAYEGLLTGSEHIQLETYNYLVVQMDELFVDFI